MPPLADKAFSCPPLADPITPAAARRLALELVALADAAEGLSPTQRPVAEWEVLAEIAELRAEVGKLRSQRQDY